MRLAEHRRSCRCPNCIGHVFLLRDAPSWAADPVDRRKFDRNAVEIPRYAQIEQGFRNEAQRLVSGYQSGLIDRKELISRFKSGLQNAETEAFVAGRRARGDVRTDISESEAKMLAGRHSRNMKYFRNFVSDMDNGRGRMSYDRRAGMYAESLWSIYTRGETSDWDEPERRNARYHWILDPDVEHCKDCIERAKLSRTGSFGQPGLTWDQISEIGWPGERTACGTNCHCHVRVTAARKVLPERFDNVGPAQNPANGLEVLEEILGGPGMPLRVPAAGVPFAQVDPAIVADSLDAAGVLQDDLAKALPTLPQTLVSPIFVNDTEVTRQYWGSSGLKATLARGEDGLWRVIAIVWVPEIKKSA